MPSLRQKPLQDMLVELPKTPRSGLRHLPPTPQLSPLGEAGKRAMDTRRPRGVNPISFKMDKTC